MRNIASTLTLGLVLGLAAHPALAADKIDPATYICAEYIALTTTADQPPLFEGLQLDGYVAAKNGAATADPNILGTLLVELAGQCATKPADKVLPMWEKARKEQNVSSEGEWNAEKSTCKQLNDDRENGEGFVVWLDGYNRQKSGKDASVLGSQESYDAYFEACKANPDKLMIDVLRDSAK